MIPPIFERDGLAVIHGAGHDDYKLVFEFPDVVMEEGCEDAAAAQLYAPDVRELRDALDGWLREVGR